MRVIATAGHVDHGKSTLVLALTGTDPDRFAEEKARGLTIDLGFAFTTLESGIEIGFVDVPGHVRFVKNMLAGVGAVDVAMLVVAANEGWMPQTSEHVAILELLGVSHGLVAVTKVDAVDADTVELAELELSERLEATALAAWPVVAVDSLTGRGLDDLRAALESVIATAPPPRNDGRPRLWVDRVFSARGAGTIVTGTLTGGELAVDDEVVVEPGARVARIRRVESHNAQLARAAPGSRVALNLAGIDHHDVRRGDAVVIAGQWTTPTTVDVSLRLLAGHPIARRGAIHAHIGSGEHRAQLRTIDSARMLARVELPLALPLAPGDRVVLRSSARNETFGGAEVLDVAPARRLRDARTRLGRTLGARVLDARPWSTPAELAPLAGTVDGDALARKLIADGDAVWIGSWLVAPETVAAARGRAVAVVCDPAADRLGTELAVLAATCGIEPAQLRAVIADEPRLVLDREVVRDAASSPVMEDPAARALVDTLANRPFDPPAPADIGAPPSLVRALVRAGELVDLGGVVLARVAFETARQRVATAVIERGALTVSDVRDLLGSSRKYVVPLLTRLDADGITRRRGDTRVPGPRAETA